MAPSAGATIESLGRSPTNASGYTVGFWDPWSVGSFAICAYPVPNQQNVGKISDFSRASAACPGARANGSGGAGTGHVLGLTALRVPDT